MQAQRNSDIDAVAGLMICVMVLGHIDSSVPYLSPFLHFFNFFMPWFYFKSGMYFREQSVKDVMSGGGKTYLSLYNILINRIIYSLHKSFGARRHKLDTLYSDSNKRACFSGSFRR